MFIKLTEIYCEFSVKRFNVFAGSVFYFDGSLLSELCHLDNRLTCASAIPKDGQFTNQRRIYVRT